MRHLSVASASLVLLVSSLASAQTPAQSPNPTCPPGSWFCVNLTPPNVPDGSVKDDKSLSPRKDGSSSGNSTGDGKHDGDSSHLNGSSQHDVDGGDGDTSSSGSSTKIESSDGHTTVIVNNNTQAPRTVVRDVPAPPPPDIEAPPPSRPPEEVVHVHHSRFRPWSLIARVEGAMMGHQAGGSSGMGGFGFSMRYRPNPWFGLDLGVDFIGGTDYQGFSRNEVPISLNMYAFFNPHDRFVLYALTGGFYSHASVNGSNASTLNSSPYYATNSVGYDYLGLDIGIGLEIRLSRALALDFDLLGFYRARTDSLASSVPEFTDPTTGATTNNSGGGLLRGGLVWSF